MRPTILFVVALLLVLGGTATSHADDPAQEAKPAGPGSAEELGKALDEQQARLEKLVALAAKDPRFRDVETYKAYRIEEFSSSKRPVEALDLLKIVSDPEAPMDLRKEALETLKRRQAQTFDPHLQRKRGQSKPRNDWFRKHVVKLLRDRKSVWTRRFAHDLLITYFPSHKNETDVVTYDPKEGSPASWRKTAKHWDTVLRK